MTILRLAPAATSQYAAAHDPSTLPSPAERLTQAGAAFGGRDFTRCLAILRQHLVESPDDLAALALLLEAGSALNPQEKPKWAAHASHTAAEIRRTGAVHAHAVGRTGYLLLMRGEVAAASALCDWTERTYRDNAETAPFLADFYSRIGEPARALARLQSASLANPDNIDLGLRVAERLVAWGRASEALTSAERLAERDGSFRSLIVLARARIAGGAAETVLLLIERALEAGAPPSALTPVAIDLLASGEPSVAHAVVDRIASLEPDDAAIKRLRAELALTIGEAEVAVESLQRAMMLQPSLPTGEALAETLLDLGRIEEAVAVAARLALVDATSLTPEIIRAKAARLEGAEPEADALDAVLMARAAMEATVEARRQRVRLAGMIGPGGLGDFVYQLLALCSLRRQFVDAGLTLFYSNDFSYKRDILRFCPDVEELRDMGATGLSIPVKDKQMRDFRQHLFFSQAALSPTLLTRLDRTATLEVPAEDVDELTAGLIAHGVDPDRWFVVMHYRDSGTFAGASRIGAFDPATARDVDPAAFHRLATSICEAGGQVVRLGHPGMAAAPRVPGYVDLVHGGLPLQLFAASRARFMIACDSGPTSYATAFKTPLLKTNAICEDGAAYAQDLILNKNLINWHGEVLSTSSMLQGRKALFKMLRQSAHGFRLADNSYEQLRHAVDLMLARTEAGGWREPQETTPGRAPNVIQWPTSTVTRAETLDLTHLAGRPVRDVSAEALASLLPRPYGA